MLAVMSSHAAQRPARRRRPGMLGMGILLAAGLLIALFPAVGARQPARAQDADVTIEMVDFPLYHETGDALDLRVRVTNHGTSTLEGFQVETTIYQPAEGRIDLHESFDVLDPDDIVYGSDRQAFDENVPPDQSTTVTLTAPLSQFTGVVNQGVHPMVVELYDSSGSQPLDSFTSELIYYPEAVEEPLNLVLVVPIAPPPARAPSGAFETDAEGSYPLETALSPDAGWLQGLLDGLEKGLERGLGVGLAPSPRLVEELADMSNGYARTSGTDVEQVDADDAGARAAEDALAQLQNILDSPRVQGLPSPYSSPDLPTLNDELSIAVSDQLETGRTTLESILPEADFNLPWLFVDGSRWDQETLEQVRRYSRGNLKTFVAATFFDPPIDETTEGCPLEPTSPQGSFTCPVRVQTETVDLDAYAQDPDVQDRFADLAGNGSDIRYLHRLFAETALIHSEAPPDSGGRIVHATVPSQWQPRPAIWRRLFRGIADAPWLAPRTPRAGLEHAVEPRPRTIVQDVGALYDDTGYFNELATASDAYGTYTELGPPEQRRERLRRNLLVAQNRNWWIDASAAARGQSYARDTEQEIEDEFAKISISGPNTTLTSQRSAIEVNVFNETTYPVTVDVDFQASRPSVMRIDESDSDELDDLVIEPGSAPAIRVDAIADTSGIFLVTASVESPETGRQINHQDITIRSTNFNQIALGLTLGALVFLIIFYLFRVIRRRRAPTEVPAESTSS